MNQLQEKWYLVNMYKLTEEGKNYLKNGLPEKQLIKFIENEKPLEEVSKLPNSQIATGWAKKKYWIVIENKIVKLTEKGKDVVNKKTDLEGALEEIDKKGETEQELIKVLLSRKLIEGVKKIEKPKKPGFFSRLFGKEEKKVEIKGEIAQLTPDLIKTGEWKNKTFRKYERKTNWNGVPRNERSFY